MCVLLVNEYPILSGFYMSESSFEDDGDESDEKLTINDKLTRLC